MSIGSGIKCFDKKRKSRRISFNTIGFTVLKSTSLYFMCPCPWFTPNTFSFTEYFRGSQRAIALFLPRTHFTIVSIIDRARYLRLCFFNGLSCWFLYCFGVNGKLNGVCCRFSSEVVHSCF